MTIDTLLANIVLRCELLIYDDGLFLRLVTRIAVVQLLRHS